MPVNDCFLYENEVLRRGESLRNGKLAFTLQDDGNLCLTYNGEFVWGTMTQDKDVQTATMQGDGNLALRNSNGDFIWGSMQNGGHMTTGRQPYVWLHDNGDVGIYAAGDDGNRIWISGTQLTVFRAVHFINRSTTVYTYPLIKNHDGSQTIWDGKAVNIWAMVPQLTPGYSQIAIDWKNAYYEKDGSKRYFRDECKAVCKLGHNVRWGDDVWVNDNRFVYDESSTNTVHIGSEAAARYGDAVFDGVSTNLWFDPKGNNDLSWATFFPPDQGEEGLAYRHALQDTRWDGTIRKPDFNDINK